MIVQGQIHGGQTQGLAPALYEEIQYDEDGNNLAGSFMDYLVPTSMESPVWETDHTCTPSPHHPLGAKGVGESATVGAPRGQGLSTKRKPSDGPNSTSTSTTRTSPADDCRATVGGRHFR